MSAFMSTWTKARDGLLASSVGVPWDLMGLVQQLGLYTFAVKRRDK